MPQPGVIPVVQRLSRYGVVGGMAALLFSGAVIVFVWLWPALGPLGANTLAFCITQPVGYYLHRRVTFPDAAGAVRQPLRFFLVNAVSFTISLATMALATQMLHVSYLWALAANWLLIPVANFIFYFCYVFEPRQGHLV